MAEDKAIVFEDLSDEECALMAILQDKSGLDLAEFAMLSPEEEDGCFRAYAFQWGWWREDNALQIDQCARSVGKSLSIKVRSFVFPFAYPGQEMVVTAPELVHLDPIVSLIEAHFYRSRLGQEMLPHGKSAVTHKPFQMNFVNGARIIGRIPQRDGKGVLGIHPIWLELDEAQSYPHAGWVELTETLKRGHKGATWRAHGVTRGIRDDFYKHTQDTPDNEWKVHRFPAMYRPNWTDEERQEKIKKYGSRDDPDYRRNVLGLHGDSANPMFVLHRLMRCVDTEQQSDYNLDEYFNVSVKSETLESMKQDIIEVLDFPTHHKKYLGVDLRKPRASFWCGMDVGYTVDPSEIVVFVEYKAKPNDEFSKLKLVSRINLQRISHTDQVRTILWTIDYYRPKAFAMDKTGLGLPLFRDIQERAAADPMLSHVTDTIKGYNFSEKIVVDFDQSIELDEFDGDPVEDAQIRRSVLEYSSDTLRGLVDAQRLELPWDADLLKQYQGSTWTSTHGRQDQYGRRRYSMGNDHVLDASRMAVLGWAQHSIEEMLKKPKESESVYDSFV